MRRLRFFITALFAVLWAAPVLAQGPTGTVRGRIIDEATQQPLARATVTVGARTALTGADGHYTLAGVPAGAYNVRARMLGYAPALRSVTVAAGGTVEVNLSMTPQAIALAEIVVTGYGEQRAGDVTGAVAQINPDEFNPGRITAPAELIQSKVAGVQVADNNEPGGGLSIRIRGATSVNASSEPLYVIDGMPIGTGAGGGLSAGRDPLNFLNPDDIESITVLKDASAASIYGANAANGVVLIQTKSRTGSRMGTQLTYSSSYSTSSVTKLPTMLTATQFRAAVQQYAPSNATQLLNATTNWFDLVTRNAFGQEQNMSLTSANERIFYRLSLGYLNQAGIVRGTNTERVSVGMNLQQRLFNDRLDLRANFRGSRAYDEFTPSGVLSNAAQMGPTQPVYDPTTATGYYDWTASPPSADNPVAILNLATDRGITWRSIGNVQADYRFPFLPALRANVNFGYDIAKADRRQFTPSTLHSQLRGDHGRLFLQNNTQMNQVFEGYLNYASALGVLPGNMDLTGGYSYTVQHSEYPWFQAVGLGTNLLGDNGIPTATTVQNSRFVVDSKLISFFARANYNLNDRYLLALSVRRDGSSRFGPGNQWGTFPSVAAAWRLSQEPFLRGVGGLSDLKLRASWAKTGNQAIGDYLQYSTYTVGDAYTQAQFGNTYVSTIRPSAVDPNIRWEATASYNVGLDFGFHNQRFSGTVDYYNKKTTDLIFYVPVAAGTNLSNYVTTNIGSMRNKGIEFSLSAQVLQGGRDGLNWTADFTAGHNTNELLEINPRAVGAQQILTGGIAGGVGTYIQVLQPGSPINSFFVCRQAYGTDGKPLEGQYLSLVGDTVLTGCANSERRAYHDPAPKWILGHTSRLTYGNFDFSFTLRAYLGNYVYNNVASNLGTYQELSRGSPYNLHTSVLETGFTAPQYLSDYYVEKASFLRMDNVTLGYTFHYRNQPLRMYLTVQNAFTLTGYSGVDPTAGLNGLDNNIYPRSRTVTGGLSYQF